MALFRKTKKRFTKKRTARQTVFRARLKRFGLGVALLVLTIWIGAWLHLSGSFVRAGHWAEAQVLAASADVGFSIENILVEGREYADVEVLQALINVQRGDPLFSFDPAEAQALVERIEWVEAAHVERRLPDTVYIGLEERKPLALFQKEKKLSLIDARGGVITRDGLGQFKDLVIVMGSGAPEAAAGLLQSLVTEPALYERTRSAGFIDQRRWDLILGNDVRVKLPEDDVELAFRRLVEAQERDGLLDKNVSSIDVRETDRIVVRTKPGGVQEYRLNADANIKANFTKSKPGNPI